MRTSETLRQGQCDGSCISYFSAFFFFSFSKKRPKREKRIFSGADIECRQSIHTEGRVKRLNLSIDLQMPLTALCMCCHSSHTAEGGTLVSVCNHCHRFPLYLSGGKLQSAGQVLICASLNPGRTISVLFYFYAKEDTRCTFEHDD